MSGAYWSKYCGDEGNLTVPSDACVRDTIVSGMQLICLTFWVIITFTYKNKSMKNRRLRAFSLRGFTGILSGLIGLTYLITFFYSVKQPLHQSINLFVQAISWIAIAVSVCCSRSNTSLKFMRTWYVVNFILGGILAISAGFQLMTRQTFSADKIVFIGSWPACFLVLVHAFKEERDASSTCEPLLVNVPLGYEEVHCPIVGASFLSRMYFLWLTPLLALGKQRPLEEADLPSVAPEDDAETAYTTFAATWHKQSLSERQPGPSVFEVLSICYWKSLARNGFYAFLKCSTLSAGPLLLNSFVSFSKRDALFKYEGYVLVAILFVAKMVESLAQRQCLFGSRRIGMRMRSGIMAALYRKELKLSNSARQLHAAGEVLNYMAVDAYRIGEFANQIHLIWTTPLQIFFALGILFYSVGWASLAGIAVIFLSMLANQPIARLQMKFQSRLMAAQDERLRAMSAVLRNMKAVKLQAWEDKFRSQIESLREEETRWLSGVQYRKTYNSFLIWLLPIGVSTSTFITCYLMGIPLNASNVFTSLATFRILQDPIRLMPDVISAVVQVRVSLTRVTKFFRDEELELDTVNRNSGSYAIDIEGASLSWDRNNVMALKNINLKVVSGMRVAICGEVGAGKSTLLQSILGEVPKLSGKIKTSGSFAYVAQAPWIQSGSIRNNILFGLPMDSDRYTKALRACALEKDMESFPMRDLTEIGERGLNLSGGQKQRIQLARALYQDADVYLLDDPFSAVDAQTGSMLFKEYIISSLAKKTVILVTHQMEFLPSCDIILLMRDGCICDSGKYDELLVKNTSFEQLVNAHKEVMSEVREAPNATKIYTKTGKSTTDVLPEITGQLTSEERRELGDTGMKPYIDYMTQANGFLYYGLAIFMHGIYIAGQMSSNWWMASQVENPTTSNMHLIGTYSLISLTTGWFILARSVLVVMMGVAASKSFFSGIMNSLFQAPMSFFDSTPSGRILSRVSVDLSIVDLDVPFSFVYSAAAFMNATSNLVITSFVTWQLALFVLPMIYLTRVLQLYYLSSARELMRIHSATKAPIINFFGETISGVTTIRAFGKEEEFMEKMLHMLDVNCSPYFCSIAAREWLIQRIETLWSTILCTSALFMVLLPAQSVHPGFVGLVLSYGLSLNVSQVNSVQNQCNLANMIISVERVKQYLSLPREASIENQMTLLTWPSSGRVELCNLQIRYRADAPLVLHGITCTFQSGQNIGIIGRTGSGKTTLISALFRLVEPAGGKILIDEVDITTISLKQLRSKLTIIPQEPTLFRGTVRFNLDPEDQYNDTEIWEALHKCQLANVIKQLALQLDSFVGEDGENWSIGERQLFCLGRALLKSSKILVVDEATASMDNATDATVQRLLKHEFGRCTTVTVAHRIPTVIHSDMVLALDQGMLVEFDRPELLLQDKSSLFCKLVSEY